MSGGIKLAPLLTEIKLGIENFKSDMDKASVIGVEGAKKMSDKMSETAKAGEQITKLGSTLTKSVTVPIISAGVATTKMAIDFESNFAKVSTLLDDSTVNYDTYKKEILDSSDEMKVAVGDYSEAVYQSISASVDQKDAIAFTNDAIKLAKGGFTSATSAVDILTTAINGYGMETSDATKISDMLITTQNLGKTTVDALASSMGKVIPIASAANFGIDELSTSYAILTKNGIDTAEAGTYIKAMLSELTKSGSEADKTLRDLTGKGFAELKSEGMSTTDILNLLSEAAEQDDKTLKDMFGSVEGGSAALVLAKDNGKDYNEVLDQMKHSAGATQEAFDKIDATPAERMKGAVNELKNAGIKLGESLIPVVEEIADKISDLADWFSDLDENQKNNLITWGGLAAAAGPALSIVGKGISTFSKLAPLIKGTSDAVGATGGASGLIGGMSGLSGVMLPLAGIIGGVALTAYGFHENAQLMNRTVLDSKEELSGMEKILAILNGTEVKSKEELENLGLVHKDFSENVSPEFQEAVKSSETELNNFKFFLGEINFDGVLTEEESAEFDSRVESMCSQAIETINAKKEETHQSLTELFTLNDGELDESEQILINFFDRKYNTSIDETNKLKTEINAIKQQAIDEGRELNEQEIKDIQDKTTRIKQIELEALGGTQEEIAYAKNEFAARVKNIDLQGASELLQEKATLRDEEIVQIEASYDTQIDMLKSNLGNMSNEEKDAAIKQIQQLETDKQTKVQQQRDLYNSFLQIIGESNPEILAAIDEGNGQILTNQGVKNRERIENWQDTYVGMDKITESGCYKIYNKEKGVMTNVAAVIDEQTGKMVGYWDSSTGETVALTDEAAAAVEDMRDRNVEGFKDVGVSVDGYTGKVSEVDGASKDMSGSIDGVTDSSDELAESFTVSNETPLVPEVDSQSALEKMYTVGQTVDDLDGKTATVYVNTSGIGAAMAGMAGLKMAGFHNFNGLDNVPYDGYVAILHKNERVLTAEENKFYSSAPDIDYDRIERAMASAVSRLSIKYNQREIGRIYNELGGAY